MNTYTSLALVLVINLVSANVFAGSGQSGKGKFMSFFDTNNDGMVTMDEFKAAAAGRFSKMDADSNDLVTLDEFKEYIKQRRNERRENWFNNIDANQDGKMSKQEYIEYKTQKAESRFLEMDTDADGSISKAEFGNAKRHRWWGKGKNHDDKDGRHKGGRFFSKLDKNGDGKITRAESLEAWQGWFNRIDADSNQVVTTEEVTAYRQKMRKD